MPCTTAGAPSWHKLVAVYAKLQVPAHFDLSADATSAASLLLDPWAHEPSDLDDDDVEEEAEDEESRDEEPLEGPRMLFAWVASAEHPDPSKRDDVDFGARVSSSPPPFS